MKYFVYTTLPPFIRISMVARLMQKNKKKEMTPKRIKVFAF
jgi:hypothetical protein